ncbi:MAG: histidine phosphatase family protein [Nanoarchaeota archaeon]
MEIKKTDLFQKVLHRKKKDIVDKIKPQKGTSLHIYLFRHGQSFDNRKKMFTGWKDSQLTPLGIENAKTIGKKLKGKKIDIAFCTHLSRSKDTLREVLRFHPECLMTIQDDRMIERCYGKLQGHTHAAFIKEHGKALFDKYHRAYDFPPPGGESLKMVEKRVKSFMADLFKFMKANKVDVAISAHNNSMRPFRRHFEKLTIKEMTQIENPWDDYFAYTLKV